MINDSVIKTHPAVFCVSDTYQIMVPVKEKAVMQVEIDGKIYSDASNGILRSETPIHRVVVPAYELDKAGKYTLIYRKAINRKPYFPEFEDEVRLEYNFYPLKPKKEKINIYHISDTHNFVDAPSEAGSYFGDDLDLLVLNGDIPDHSGEIKNFDTIYEIVSRITKGGKPTVFSRGNHDMRGIHAEDFANYTPADRGNSYYSFRVGGIWALLIDCGEDKRDDFDEYGHTIDCHGFRREQDRFIDKIIENAEREYNALDVEYKLVISHVPFSHKIAPPFDIEEELYTSWCNKLNDIIKPHLQLSGHLHLTKVMYPDDPLNTYGAKFPVIIGSSVFREEKSFTGCALTLERDKATVVFNNNKHGVVEKTEIKF